MVISYFFAGGWLQHIFIFKYWARYDSAYFACSHDHINTKSRIIMGQENESSEMYAKHFVFVGPSFPHQQQ